MSPSSPAAAAASIRQLRIARQQRQPRQAGILVAAAIVSLVLTGIELPAHAEPAARTASNGDSADRLLAAYPEHIREIRDGQIHFRDGTTMPLDDGRGPKNHAEWLANPDVEDMLAQPYVSGPVSAPPSIDSEPGRARNEAFFSKIYGDCRSGAVTRKLADVVWLPAKSGVKIKVTSENGVAKRLRAVSRALDRLPQRFDIYLMPPAGTYNCRQIAGTNRLSAHAYGIAIDIATSKADYWRWSKPGPDGQPRWRNRIPHEIVAIFEAHGFIWGGKWHHHDTMHFEYRPELLPPSAALE